MKNPAQNSKLLRFISFAVSFCLLLVNNAGAAVFYWDNNGLSVPSSGTWDTTTAEWSSTSALSGSLVVWNTANAACFTAGTVSPGAITITVNTAIGFAGIFNGSLVPPPCDVTISGSGSLNLNSGAQGFSTFNNAAGFTRIKIPITGAGQVTPENTGQLFLDATNTYTGGTLLGFSSSSWTGLVNFNNTNSFGPGTITINNTTTGIGALVLEPAVTDPITITNKVVVGLNFTVAANPRLNIVANAAGLTFSGPWTLATNGVIGVAASTLVNISGIISGSFAFGKFNPGILEFTATNTYTGNTTVSNGVLQLGDGVARNGAVAGTITVTSPGSLVFANPTDLSYAKAISGTGAFTKQAAGILTLTVADTYSGGTTISAGTLKQGVANVIPSGSGKGDLGLDGTLDLASFACGINGLNGGSGGVVDSSTGAGATLTAGNNAANGNFAGTLKNTVGALALTKAGAGTLTLSGPNTYSGLTTVSAGTLQLGASGTLPAVSILIVANGATLDLAGLNGTNAALSGAGSVINNNASFTLNGNANGPAGQIFNAYSCFSGVLNGGGSFVKAGTHAMALRGDNSGYGGTVTFNAGTLSVGAAANRLPIAMTLSVPTGALFQLDASSQTVGSLNGTGSVNLGGGSLTVNQNGSDTFNGVIQNSELPGSSTALGHGLRGYYYTNVDFTGLSTVRDDSSVSLPDMTALPGYSPTAKTNQISVRWLGQVLTTVAGTYSFVTRCDDGQRLWVNGVLLVDDWNTHGATSKTNTLVLAATNRYDLVMEYFNNGGAGSAALSWAPPGDSPVLIPASNLLLPGPGVLVKSGGGIQQLATPSTYSGGTMVSAGTLQATNGALGSGNVAVADGAILEIDSTTTINSAADLVLTPATANVYLNFGGQNNLHAISFDGGVTHGPTGTYGPTGSGANHENAVFTGSGYLNVTATASTNVLTASPSPAVYASPVNLTSTVTGSGATPTGTVTFYDNGNFLGTSALNGSGVATLSVSNLIVSASPHSLTAVYGGDTTHATSASGIVSITTTPGTITPIPVVANKAYDGTSNATIASITFGGILDGDTNYVHISGAYTAFFSDQYVGVNKSVSITNLVLTGSLSTNYVLFTNAVSTTASITNKVLTISGITATNRIYDSTTNEGFTGSVVLNGVIAADVGQVTNNPPTVAFITKNSGLAKPVTVTAALTGGLATNYFLLLTNLSANITNFSVTVTNVTANPKVYDGGTNATLSGTPALIPPAFAGDDVTIAGAAVANFTNAAVGLRGVTVTGYSLLGGDAANYSLFQPTNLTATISKAGTIAAITSSVNPSLVTSNVTFKCTVTSTTPTTNPPTSTVTFFTNGILVSPAVTLVSNTPSSSTAAFTTSLLPVGTNSVAAVYGGDANFSAALQVTTNQVVQTSTVCSQTNSILSITSNGANSYTLNFIGTYQAQYYVVSQTNLAQPMVNWIPVPGATNTVTNVAGLWSVTVTNPAPAFYRSKAMSVCP
jgi:autotransporter-associated beta strand protein